ncbi:MAG TPA: alpha/beta fold hydrolase [Terriglobia bacterium]|nr:alpha/beta fold hydrolase [Terriglobia bacterium]
MPALEPATFQPSDSTLNRPEPEEVFVLPASLGQERFWHLDRLNPRNPTWMVPVRFRLQGPLNPAFVGSAFNEIVRRHEPLRTTFRLMDGQPFQVIKPVLKIDVQVTDLRHLPKPERDREVDRLSFEEARRGFDLAVGPLFRVSLIQVEDNEHVLLVTPHHSVADYWSIGLISNELGSLYDAYSRGTDLKLPELSIQYGDFAVWQREQAEGAVVQNELAYWKKQLKDLPLLEFPADHPRPNFPTYDATITSILLPVSLTDAMREIANRSGATFFNTMLAVLGIVLHQYTRQTDFGVATQVAGRSSVELEPLIGLFINTVVLRMDLAGDPSFTQLLARVQDVGLQALANQNVRFEQVLRELRPNDYPSHHTLFRVNFICQRDPVKPLEFSGIKLTVIPSKSQGALYDLNVFLVLRTEGWRLACEYNTDLFEASTITGLLGNYRKLLEAIVINPDGRLSELPLPELTAPARHERPAAGPPAKPSAGVASADATPPRSLGAAAAAQEISPNADSPAASSSQDVSDERYVMPTSAAQRRFWALEELAPGNPGLHMRACVRLTGALSQTALERSLQFLVDRHETLRTTFERLDDDFVQVIAPSQTICLPVTSLDDVTEADREARLWEAIRAEASAPFDLSCGPLIRARLFRLRPQEHVLVITTHHILTDGWSQNVIQRDLWTIYEAIAEDREPSLPPLAIQYGDFVHWQLKWLASECARQQIDFWKKQLASPLPVLNLPSVRPSRNRAASQGPMETLLLPDDLVRSLKSLGQSHEATMFMVMLTAYSALLNRYTRQEDILISSPVANRRSETEPLIGPFAGPVALRLNLSGNPTLRELLGRVRDVTLDALSHADLPFEALLEKLNVRSIGGRNPLSQCYFFYQTAFLQPRQLPDLTVAPLPDFGLGTHFELQMGLLERREGVRAQLEYNPGLFEPATIKEILSSYEAVLRAFVANAEQRLSGLPLSMQTAPQSSQPANASQPENAPPQNETEKQLAEIWEALLMVRPIGLHQDYFELGGNSLLAVRLFAEIEKAFNVKLPLSTLIEARTISEFAHVLRRKGSAPNWSPLVAMRPGGSRPPFFCVHGGGGNVLLYRDLSRRLGPDQPFFGLQSQGLNGGQPLLSRIEDMAAVYVKEVQKVQPHGPYFFGGYCLGGTIALEMAQQFKAQGEEVALLALFDTLNWSKLSPGTVWNKAYYQAQRLVFHGQNFLLLSFEDKLKFLRGKLAVLGSRSSVWRGMLLGRLAKEQGKKSESLLLARIWKANDRAALNYVPRPYPGIITDFRPMKQYARYNEPGVYWDDVALEGQEIVTLPMYPAGMLLEPFVEHLAARLTASIDKAIQASSLAHTTEAESVLHHQEVCQ